MWGQVATSLVKQDNLSVTLACKLFDHHRQSFYQLKSDIEKDIANERRVLESVCEIRAEDPGIGAYKLWLMMRNIYGYEAVMGRDRFFPRVIHIGNIGLFRLLWSRFGVKLR